VFDVVIAHWHRSRRSSAPGVSFAYDREAQSDSNTAVLANTHPTGRRRERINGFFSIAWRSNRGAGGRTSRADVVNAQIHTNEQSAQSHEVEQYIIQTQPQVSLSVKLKYRAR